MLRSIQAKYESWAMEHWPEYDDDPGDIAARMQDCLWGLAATQGLQGYLYTDGDEYLHHVARVYRETSFAVGYGDNVTLLYAPLGKGTAVLDVTVYASYPPSVPF